MQSSASRAWLLLLTAVAFTILAALGVHTCLGIYSENKHVAALRNDGVITRAVVLRTSYDPSGGDPNGWTSDVVSYVANGKQYKVTLGHHGANTSELKSSRLPVIYSDGSPRIVMSLAVWRNATPRADLAVSITGTILSVVGVALMSSWWVRRRIQGNR